MPLPYKSVGFIGIGQMGLPMALNLRKSLSIDASFYVFDVVPAGVEALIRESTTEFPISRAESVAEVAAKSDLIITMLPEGSHVRDVYLSETGILSTPCDGKLLIDCSTIDTATSLDVRKAVTQRYPSANFFDAPVSGGVIGARKASLTFMVGCAPTDPRWEELRTLLATMGAESSIFACGGPSLGLTAKFCNNYCSGLIAIATSEAFNIAIRAGIDPRVLNDVFSTSTAGSNIQKKFHPVPGLSPEAPPSHGYQGGFKVQLMKKDFGLAVDTAKAVGAKLLLGETGLKVYQDASLDERCRDLDSRVVYRFLDGVEDWKERFGKES